MELAEIEVQVMKLSEEDRADLAAMIWDSLDGADPNDSDEDSLTEAIRRGEELWSGAVVGLSKEELLNEIRASRIR
jgi:putative addiction module component (TIGR02574 family)